MKNAIICSCAFPWISMSRQKRGSPDRVQPFRRLHRDTKILIHIVYVSGLQLLQVQMNHDRQECCSSFGGEAQRPRVADYYHSNPNLRHPHLSASYTT